MPIEHADIEPLLANAEEAFRLGGQQREDGIDVSDAGLVQRRKASRSLSGATQLVSAGYFTLTIEAAFTSLEKTLLFWLIHEGYHDPSNPPQSHTTAIQRSAEVGFIDDEVAERLTALWKTNRAQTYYQNGLPTRERADALAALAIRIHELVVGLVRIRHECVCQ